MATDPNEAPEACAICGYHPDQCTCPVCPECGRQGDPACMGVHVPYRFTETLVAGGAYMSWAMYYGETFTDVAGRPARDLGFPGDCDALRGADFGRRRRLHLVITASPNRGRQGALAAIFVTR